jgi:GTPase
VIGNVDSGKSTLVGVLTKGIFDDGRGSARERIFNY